MFGNFSLYDKITFTPSTITSITLTNNLGVIPKYIHITCASTDAPFTTNGYIREMWLLPPYGYGREYGTNGSSGDVLHHIFSSVDTTPSAVNTFHVTSSIIEIYKGTGSVSGRWHTGTTYTAHIYA